MARDSSLCKFYQSQNATTCCLLTGGRSTARRCHPSWRWKATHPASWHLAPPVGSSPAPGYGTTALWSWSEQHLKHDRSTSVSFLITYSLETLIPQVPFNQNTVLQEAISCANQMLKLNIKFAKRVYCITNLRVKPVTVQRRLLVSTVRYWA